MTIVAVRLMGVPVRRLARVSRVLARITWLALVPLTIQAATAGAQVAADPSCAGRLQPGPRRAVTQVIDGETLLLDDGSIVRLIGALAPLEPPGTAAYGKAPSWPPAVAAKRELEALAGGRSVDLAFAGARRDRYGRRLAQVFVPSAGTSAGAGAGARVWLQGALIAKGLARAYGRPGNDACLADLLQIESGARAVRAGLWANAAYQVRSAHRPFALLRYRHRFQIVEGRVAKVGRASSRLYLNFGANWRNDFTVGIERRDLKGFAAAGLRPAKLAGRRVRVRGWIERRGGPFIAARIPGQIEVLPDQ